MHPDAIGPFKIERELGRGGMGEVLLARDSRLDRQVAIKALPAHLAQDPDRLARFQREAKVLASLNHPGIGAIYGLEEADGHQYLILEFVEGETLADRLAKGAIPVNEALGFAKQIAEALEVAHEKGVVHRDLKPGNVMLTLDDMVKVLDFGLARTADAAASNSHASVPADSPTVTSPARVAHSPTIPGVIMGSAGYMSPEQARGKQVDKRSDIFSFGCVLFEMLSGKKPFAGETVADAIGATLHKETDHGLLPPGTPRRVRELLTNCLAKDRKQRLHDIADARLEIVRAIAEPRETAQSSAGLRPWWRSPAVLVTALLATVSLVALAVVVLALMLRPSQDATRGSQRVLRTSLAIPKGMTLLQTDRAVAVSPDGTQVVLSLGQKDDTSPPSLFLRDLSRLEFRALAGTQGATYPFWSPDGKSIAFLADRKLKRLDLADGIVRTLCEAPAGRGGSWGSKGTIVFAPSAGGGLSIVSDAGGTPTPITTTATPGESHRVPQFLPDGQRFLYYAKSLTSGGTYAFDPATKQSRPITKDRCEALYVEPGYLIFARDENLMVQPFDLARLELTGSAKPIAAGVQYIPVRAFISGGVSPSGTLVYQQVISPARAKLAWMDRKGEQSVLSAEPIAIGIGARLTKDARRAVVMIDGNRGDASTAVVDLERGITTRVSDPKLPVTYGAMWSAGEETIIAVEARDGKQLLANLPSGGGAGTRLTEGEPGFEYDPGSITPDGTTLIFTRTPLSDKTGDIMTLRLDQDEPAMAFMKTSEAEWVPRLSPTGDVLAYVVSDRREDATATLKLVTFPTPGTPVQVTVSPTAFGAALWLSPTELAWADPSGRMWSAIITGKGDRIDVGVPKPMLDGKPLDKQTRILDYDMTKERFLIAINDEPPEEPGLIFVSDWRAEVNASQPARK